MKKASVLFLAIASVAMTACSPAEKEENEVAEKITYSLDAENSTLHWHGEENKNHYHDGVISITEGTLTIQGDEIIGGEFIIDAKSIQAQTEGYEEGKMAYLSSHLQDTAFLFVAEYPTISVKTGTFKNGNLDATINVRGVDIKTQLPVTIKSSEKEASVIGKFAVNFSGVGMPYLEQIDEETGAPSAKPDFEFELNLKLKR